MATPIQLPVTAQTDASGNATISKVIRAAYWTAVYATAQCQGTAAWVLGPAGTAIAFQEGANVVLGPIFVGPGESAQLQVAGATPNTPVTVTFWGFQGAAQDGSDLPPLVPSVETAGSLLGIVGPVTIGGGSIGIAGQVPVVNGSSPFATTRAQYQLGTFIATHAAITNRTYNIDQDTHAIGIAMHGSGAPPLIQVNGVQTGVSYVTQTPQGGAPTEVYALVPVTSAWDSQVTISINNGDPTNDLTVYVAGIRDPQVLQVLPGLSDFKTVMPVQLQDGAGHAAGLDTSSAFGNFLQVSSQFSKLGAGWQAPQSSYAADNVSIAAGGTLQLVPAVANRVVYCHGLWIFGSSATGQEFIHLEDTAGIVTLGGLVAYANGVAYVDFKGQPTVTGRGVRLKDLSTGLTNVSIYFGYTQQ